MGIDDIPADTLEDAAQIRKANSIQGERGARGWVCMGGWVGVCVRGGGYGGRSGWVIDDIPADTLEDAAQITKANSIQGETAFASYPAWSLVVPQSHIGMIRAVAVFQ